MPAVPAPAKVLVTGVNGYVGIWVTRRYLGHGYSVRGTVRSIERAGKHLRNAFASYGDKFELVEVADITSPGAFDEAVKGVDVVAHTASPFHYNANDPSEVIDPAVKGTTSILVSIKAHGTAVKRVVLTSSIVALWEWLIDSPRTFDETTWNEQAIQLVKDKGGEAGGATIYGAAKTLAEKAAWAFFDENKPSWDLAVINPPYIYGPPIHEVKSADALNTSQKMLFDILTGKLPEEEYETTSLSFVDVRDIAEIHVRAAEIEKAGGTRCLISAGTVYPQELLDIANSIEPKPWDGLPKGKPGATKDKGHLVNIRLDQFARVYGFKTHTPAETIRDSLEDFKARGWIH